MKSNSRPNSRKSPVKPLHGIVQDPTIGRFLQSMGEFDANPDAGDRRLHLATNLIKMMIVSDIGSAMLAFGPRAGSDVSNCLSTLEAFFGCPLRDESGQALKFNARGKELVDLTRSILTSFGEFYRKCHDESPKYIIAAGDSLLHLLLFPKLHTIQENLRGMLDIRDLSTIEIHEALQERRIDFAVVTESAVSGMKSVEVLPLGEQKYRVFASRVLTPTESDLMALNAPLAISRHWDINFQELAAEKKTRLNVKVWCRNFSHVARLVRLGHYAGILPQLAGTVLLKDEYVDVQPEFLKEISRPVVLAWNPRLKKVRPQLEAASIYLGQALKF